ncbi:MAG: glycosyltransferase family 1 protein [Pseudomonadota bacterium]
MTLYVNGRFLTQPVSGVQRYCLEVLGALDQILQRDRGRIGPVEVLVPRAVPAPPWQVLRARVLSGGTGHIWEQGTLFHATRGGPLVSLGNSGPLRHRAHILCLHDANLFEIPEAFSPRYRVWHRMLRPMLARRAAVLLTVSRHSAQALSRHLHVDARRFEVVPNSAEHVLGWPSRDGVPARYGLVPGAYLLSVGNQSPNKNIARLIQAHDNAGPKVPPLAIVGGAVPGLTSTGTRQAERVHLLGRVPDADLRGLYEGAAGFVFPSLYEGFGIPPLEAMQLGVPVLCARSGAMPEVLGPAPIWFDPRDPTDIARCLQAFAAMDAVQRRAQSVLGRSVAAQYRWATSAERLLNSVEQLTGQARRRAA